MYSELSLHLQINLSFPLKPRERETKTQRRQLCGGWGESRSVGVFQRPSGRFELSVCIIYFFWGGYRDYKTQLPLHANPWKGKSGRETKWSTAERAVVNTPRCIHTEVGVKKRKKKSKEKKAVHDPRRPRDTNPIKVIDICSSEGDVFLFSPLLLRLGVQLHPFPPSSSRAIIPLCRISKRSSGLEHVVGRAINGCGKLWSPCLLYVRKQLHINICPAALAGEGTDWACVSRCVSITVFRKT